MKLFTSISDRTSDGVIFKPAKLNERGVLHHVLPLIFVVIFAIVGVGYLVYTHATTAQVKSVALASDCINVLGTNGDSLVANATVDLATCNGSKTENISVTGSGTQVRFVYSASNGSHCLEPKAGGTAVGTPVVSNSFATCAIHAGSQTEYWEVTNGGYENVGASLCLATSGVASSSLTLAQCNPASNKDQEWTPPGPPPAPAPAPNPNPNPTPPPPTTGSSSEDIISTLYAYPTEAPWQQVESAAPTVKYAIVNICAPDGTGSGCGSPADEANPDWVPTIAALKAAGITPLYYISTNYDAIPLATIESELANAKTWYGVTDPMFDTTATDNATYYNDLYTYAVNTIGADKVVFNTGTTLPNNSYMFDGTTGTKETIQVFEGTAAGFEGTTFPSWMSAYPASDFAATLSVGTSSTVGTDVNDAVKDNIGNFYEDDEAESPNYATLPAFWSTEVTDVANAK